MHAKTIHKALVVMDALFATMKELGQCELEAEKRNSKALS